MSPRLRHLTTLENLPRETIERLLDRAEALRDACAHGTRKLDMLAGTANGVPPLPSSMNRRQWIDTMQRGFDRLSKAVDRGRHTAIDPYATEAPEEYFAVTSELHFSRPALLREAEPDVATLLDAFYGPSPAQA